jgi:protocatechuate 3,4-dioxygenase beta subunit
MLKPRIDVLILTLICCLFSGFISQIEPLAQSTETKEGTAEVSGRVTLKGEPASGIIVALDLRQKPGQNPTLRSKTDAKGIYRITRVPAGQYFINALAPGFFTPKESPGGMGKAITIYDGEIIENINFALKPGSVITGRVTDANGHPFIGESVHLYKINEKGKPIPFFFSSEIFMSRTDDRGDYRLYGLEAGRYLVYVGGGGSGGGSKTSPNRRYYPPTFHPDATEVSKAKVIELDEGGEATGVDISMGEAKKTFQVLGRVIDADSGQPLPGLEIQLGTYRPNGRGVSGSSGAGELSGPRGEFRVEGVIPGKYAAFTASRRNAEYYSDPAPFEVIDSNVSGVEIKAKRGATISGFVMVEGTNDPAVLAKLPQIELEAYIRSDQILSQSVLSGVNMDGSFRFAGLPPGKARILLTPKGEGHKFWMIRLERGGSLSPYEEIEIGPGEQINNFRLVVVYGDAVLHGQIKIPGMSFPEGVTCRVYARRSGGPTSLSSFKGDVDAGGKFLIKSLVPGEYELTISLSIRSNPASIDRDRRLMEAAARFKETVTINSGAENHVTLTLNLDRQEDNR